MLHRPRIPTKAQTNNLSANCSCTMFYKAYLQRGRNAMPYNNETHNEHRRYQSHSRVTRPKANPDGQSTRTRRQATSQPGESFQYSRHAHRYAARERELRNKKRARVAALSCVAIIALCALCFSTPPQAYKAPSATNNRLNNQRTTPKRSKRPHNPTTTRAISLSASMATPIPTCSAGKNT